MTKIKEALQNLLHPISAAQKIFFINGLRVILKAGLSAVEALRILSLQIDNPNFQKTINQIRADLENGSSLTDTLANYPKIFPNIYVKMINAGEISGKLDESLMEIVNQMKKNQEIASKVRGAMIYPAVLVVAMVGVSIEMTVFVLPKLLDIFKETNVPLPLPTRILIALSNLLTNYGPLILVLIIALVIMITLLYRRGKKFKLWCHALYLQLPIFGGVIKQINLARFSLTMSSLFKSAVPIVTSFEICAEVLGNLLFKNALLALSQKIKTGSSIAENLEKTPKLFPPLVSQMILIGEKTGRLEDMLGELADYYQAEADQTIKNISTVIEPLLVVMMGLVVGGLAVSVIQPIYSLSEGIQ